MTANTTVRIQDLPAANTIGANDVFVVAQNLSTLPHTSIITYQNFFNGVNVAVSFSNTVIANSITVNNFIISNLSTPISSNQTSSFGTISFDANYLYITVANNTIKRILLTAF